MRRIFRAAAASGVGAAAGLVSGVVRVKLYALFLGAAGMGIVSQVANLYAVLTVLATLGLSVGISKTVAESRARDDPPRVRGIVWTALLTVGALASAISIALLALATPIASWALGDAHLAPYVAWSASCVLFMSLARIFGDLTSGIRDVRTAMWSGVVGALVSLLPITLLVPRFGLPGAMIALALVALVSATITGTMLFQRQRWMFLPFSSRRADSHLLVQLGKIGLATLTMGFLDQFALLTVRTDLIRRYGAAANGHFQGAFGLFQQLFVVAIAFVGAYSFPRVSEARTDTERNEHSIQAIKMILLLLGGGCSVLVLFRHLVVRALLSSDFLPSLPLFPWQAAGDFARGAGLALQLALLPRGGIRKWLALNVWTTVALLIAYHSTKQLFGPAAATVAWCLSGFFFLIGGFWIMSRTTGLRLPARELIAVCLAAPLFAGLAALSRGGYAALGAGVLLIGAWLLIGLRARDLKDLLGPEPTAGGA